MFKWSRCLISGCLVLFLFFQTAAFAASSSEIYDSIIANPGYDRLVDRLDDYTSSDNIDSVISQLSSSIANKNYGSKEQLKDDVLVRSGLILMSNKEVKEAIKQAYSAEYEDYKNGSREVPDILNFAVEAAWNTIRETTQAAGGGASGSPEEFVVKVSGAVAEVETKGKLYVFLTNEQIGSVKDSKKDLSMSLGDVTLLFSTEALNINELVSKEKSLLNIMAVPVAETTSLLSGTKEGYKLVGKVYELLALVVDKDNNKKQEVARFNGIVTVSLPVPTEYKEKAVSGSVKVYYYNEDLAKWELVNGTYDKAQNVMKFSTTHFSKYALLETVFPEKSESLPKFEDIKGHWAAEDIKFMAAKGYVSGLENNKFAPQEQVTRAQFAAMLVKVLGVKESSNLPFKDVEKDAWYYASITKAYSAGLVKGKDNQSFDPNATITRQEMSAMLYNAMKLKGTAADENLLSLEYFVDNHEISDWAKQSASVVSGVKIVKGKPSDKGVLFAPQDNATRAEAVVMLKNLINL